MVFLASDECAMLTGETIAVNDGSATLQRGPAEKRP